MAPTLNGDKPSSVFLQHLTSYPVISDSVSAFQSNPYGAKSIELSTNGYNAFAKPILPYFAKPYEFVSPYVAKADSIGDAGLSKVDETFPAVKKPTGELIDNGKSIAFLPLRMGFDAKDYVFKTYNSECKKVGGEGVVTYGKALVTTALIVSSDGLGKLSEFLSAKKEQAKEVSNEKLNN